MKRAVRLLITTMTYEVPEQDLHVNLSKMPTMPQSRFVITDVGSDDEARARRGQST